MIRKLLTLILLITLTACSAKQIIIPSTPQEEACKYSYCMSTEDDVRKAALLRLLELGASAYNIELEIGEGVCTELYNKRDLDYRYAFKTALEICNGE